MIYIQKLDTAAWHDWRLGSKATPNLERLADETDCSEQNDYIIAFMSYRVTNMSFVPGACQGYAHRIAH